MIGYGKEINPMLLNSIQTGLVFETGHGEMQTHRNYGSFYSGLR